MRVRTDPRVCRGFREAGREVLLMGVRQRQCVDESRPLPLIGGVLPQPANECPHACEHALGFDLLRIGVHQHGGPRVQEKLAKKTGRPSLRSRRPVRGIRRDVRVDEPPQFVKQSAAWHRGRVPRSRGSGVRGVPNQNK